MKEYYYFAPAPQEQQGFAMQALGTLLAVVLVVVLVLRGHDPVMRGVLLGGAAGSLWLLGRAAWALEQKAQRARHGMVALDEAGLHLTDLRGRTRTVAWTEISGCAMKGGRLAVRWAGGEVVLGAREIEDGISLIQEILRRHAGDSGLASRPSNFIPLEPR